MQDYLNKKSPVSSAKYARNEMAILCFNSLKGEQKNKYSVRFLQF